MLDGTDVTLIRESFRAVARDAATAADRFYERLFEIDPSLRSMFTGDMARQKAMLMGALGAVVANLERWDALTPTLDALATRHVGYGVKPEHYPLVGAALLDTLGAALAEDFTPETAAAWAKAYGALCERMVRTAYGAAGSPG